MRKLSNLLLVIILFLTFGLAPGTPSAQAGRQENQPSSITPVPIVQEMIDQVSQERLLTDLRRFTGEEQICTSNGCTTLTGRYTGSENLNWAKDYVRETLRSLHYPVEVLNWQRSGYSDQNILAHKRGFLYPNVEIYFIAHLDGHPTGSPAADDNGTGAAALLELARILAQRTICYSVTLFFSTGEEQGSLGSHQFVADYPDRVEKIKYLVNIEMLGYDSNNDGQMEFFNGSQPQDFVESLVNIIQAYPLNLDPHIYSDCG